MSGSDTTGLFSLFFLPLLFIPTHRERSLRQANNNKSSMLMILASFFVLSLRDGVIYSKMLVSETVKVFFSLCFSIMFFAVSSSSSSTTPVESCSSTSPASAIPFLLLAKHSLSLIFFSSCSPLSPTSTIIASLFTPVVEKEKQKGVCESVSAPFPMMISSFPI